MWDINLEEENAEFRDDLRAATGIGKRKKKVFCHLNDSILLLKYAYISVEDVQVQLSPKRFNCSSERVIKHLSMETPSRPYA